MASFDPSERQPVADASPTSCSVPRHFLENKIQRFLSAYAPLIGQLRCHSKSLQTYCLEDSKDRIHSELVNASRTIKRGQSIQEEFRQIRVQIPYDMLVKYESQFAECTQALEDSIEILVEVCAAVGHTRSFASASLIGVDRSSTSSSCASNSFSTPRNTPTSSSRLSPLTPKSPSERCVKSSSGSLQFFYSEDEQGSAESSLDSEELAAQASGARHAPLATAEATRGEDYSELVQDTLELNELMHSFAKSVVEQRQFVDNIAGHVDHTATSVREGVADISVAAKLKAAMLPVACGTVGAVIAGPVGLIAGLKLGAVAAAGAAGVGGVLIGRKLKSRKEEQITHEMNALSS